MTEFDKHAFSGFVLHPVTEFVNRGCVCPVCQGNLNILDRVFQVAPDIFVCVSCGFWLRAGCPVDSFEVKDNVHT